MAIFHICLSFFRFLLQNWFHNQRNKTKRQYRSVPKPKSPHPDYACPRSRIYLGHHSSGSSSELDSPVTLRPPKTPFTRRSVKKITSRPTSTDTSLSSTTSTSSLVLASSTSSSSCSSPSDSWSYSGMSYHTGESHYVWIPTVSTPGEPASPGDVFSTTLPPTYEHSLRGRLEGVSSEETENVSLDDDTLPPVACPPWASLCPPSLHRLGGDGSPGLALFITDSEDRDVFTTTHLGKREYTPYTTTHLGKGECTPYPPSSCDSSPLYTHRHRVRYGVGTPGSSWSSPDSPTEWFTFPCLGL